MATARDTSESLDIEVAICTYNNAQVLDRALSALEQQRVSPSTRWSLTVVNNNSTDDTVSVVQRHIEAGLIPNMRLVQEPVQGLGYARRRAMNETSADIIAFVDDDCMLSPEWVEAALTFCRAHPNAGAVGGRVHLLWEVPPTDFVKQYKDSFAYQDHGEFSCQLPSKGWTYLVGAGLVLRRSAMEASGWVEKGNLNGNLYGRLDAGDDSEIVLRIRKAGYELWYNPLMALQHFIPVRRMSVEHICELHAGFGRSWPILRTLAYDENPTLWKRMRSVCSSLRELVRVLTAVPSDLIHNRQIRPRRRIEIHEKLGRVHGAFDLLKSGYNV